MRKKHKLWCVLSRSKFLVYEFMIEVGHVITDLYVCFKMKVVAMTH